MTPCDLTKVWQRAVGRFAEDPNVGPLAEERPKAAPNDFVVIRYAAGPHRGMLPRLGPYFIP